MDAGSGQPQGPMHTRSRGGDLVRVFTLLGVVAALSVTSTATAAPPSPALQDSAVGSGSTAIWTFDFNVTSDASGANPSGSATADGFGGHFVSSSISCLAVRGNVATFAGTLGSNTFGLTNFKVTVADNGPAGSGLDTLAIDGSTTPQDCSTDTTTNQAPLISGDIVVIDSPPTSVGQCGNGGYARFGFLNKGLCIAFVLRAAAMQDSAVGSGSTAIWTFDFNVTSDASGANPSGSATADGFGGHFVSSSISCLAVRGNVATFAGTLGSNTFGLTNFKVTVADNGPAGSGLDTLAIDGSTTPQDCSTDTTTNQAPLISGDISVIDSPPTSDG